MSQTTNYAAREVSRAPSPRMRLRLSPDSPLFYAFCVPAAITTMGILIPFLTMVYYTLTNKELAPIPYHFVGLTNYVLTFTDSAFWQALSVTLLYAVGACAVELPLGLAVAWVLNHDFVGARLLRVAMILPMVIPPVVGALIWKMMLDPSTGVLTYFLASIGIRNFPGFAGSSTALLTIIVVDVWLFTPFVALIALAALRSVPGDILESAMMDGASSWHTFRHIVLPLISPFLVLITLFRGIDSLKAFDTIYATTEGGPVNATMNFTMQAYMRAFQWHEVGGGLVYMVVLWVVIFLISQILMRLWAATLTMK